MVATAYYGLGDESSPTSAPSGIQPKAGLGVSWVSAGGETAAVAEASPALDATCGCGGASSRHTALK
tara:strand:+ start:1090 stop:1290 length:201 start_codon:yes stop_codon:yes gene_type:complete